MLEIELDGNKLEVPDGSTVMDAARLAGIYVPHFCYHRKLSIAANCRMCLVQIEKAPKPMPACATPVTNGMKVQTHSEQAVNAQKGVMEFLLINHPLDCPICDQGGECQLQDLAVGYGSSGSRYEEDKRVVVNKDLGPLISTDMTRCIHCTRCVRFGQEIAGVMELGMIGRGEHVEIITFVGKTVDSELSGNVIDLCPVGALTSKPFRYSARTWELTRRPAVSPHCGLGSNLTVQIKQNRVMRVLPRENELINECWLSDKDRFSYEGLNSEHRLAKPMLKRGGVWKEVEWQVALDYIVKELKRIGATNGAATIGALATANQTLEELYLLGKLMRGMGSDNIDFRLRQSDFSADGKMAGVPWLGMKIAEFSALDRVLLVGSTLRKDHPLIAQRLRQLTKKTAQLNVIHCVDDDLLMRVTNKSIVAPAALVDALAQVVKATANAKDLTVPDSARLVCERAMPSEVAHRIAASLVSGKCTALLLGNFAQHHPHAATLHALVQALSEITGARFGYVGEAANSVGGYVAGAVPKSEGKNAAHMVSAPLKACVLLGVEIELDMHSPRSAIAAMKQAELVVAMSPYQHKAVDYAHVLLPISPFTETAGTFVNTEGAVQSFNGVVQPLGETRPAWKVLRVLGNLLGLDGFDQDSAEDVRLEALGEDKANINLNNKLHYIVGSVGQPLAKDTIERIAEVPIYAADAIARRAPSLQKTRDAAAPVVGMNRKLADKLGVGDGDLVRVTQGDGVVIVPCAIDSALPDHCIRLACAREETSQLDISDAVSIARVDARQAVVV